MKKDIDDINTVPELREAFMEKQTEAETWGIVSALALSAATGSAPIVINALSNEHVRNVLSSPSEWVKSDNIRITSTALAGITFIGAGIAATVKSWRSGVESGVIREKINATLTGEKMAEAMEERDLVVLKRESLERANPQSFIVDGSHISEGSVGENLSAKGI